jgi:hypothetical protein
MESIIGALNALILNVLVTRVNTGQGKNIPVASIVMIAYTLYSQDRPTDWYGPKQQSECNTGFQDCRSSNPIMESGYAESLSQQWVT